MASYEYKGVVEEIGETQTFGANGFTKREIVVGNDVDSDNRYPNPVLFTFKKNNCQLLDPVKKGDRVNIKFAIDGRRWDGPKGVRYFTDLTGLKIDVLAADGGAEGDAAVPPPAEAPDIPADASDPDDLPF